MGNKLRAPALQKLMKERGLFEDLTQAEEDEMLREFEESRGLKKSGTRLNNAAATRDVTAFTKFINREVRIHSVPFRLSFYSWLIPLTVSVVK